jgi:hypothetical protein
VKRSTEKGDILSSTRDNLIAVVQRDEQNVHIRTDMHHPATNGNLCDECVVPAKPAVMGDYNRHMDYVDLGDRMLNGYLIQCQRWEWTKNFFLMFC